MKLFSVKKSGMSVVEILVTVMAFAVVGTAISLVAVTSTRTNDIGKNITAQTNNARNALAQLSADISSSNRNTITVTTCGSECRGKRIALKVPVRDAEPIKDTMVDANGRVKLGADGKQFCYYQYMVLPAPNDQLVKTLMCAAGDAYCGDYKCKDTSPIENVDCKNADGSAMTDCFPCPTDCGSCGDGKCTAEKGETAGTCIDCSCNDGICNFGETRTTCPADCSCGDGVCNYAETHVTCPVDCP